MARTHRHECQYGYESPGNLLIRIEFALVRFLVNVSTRTRVFVFMQYETLFANGILATATCVHTVQICLLLYTVAA